MKNAKNFQKQLSNTELKGFEQIIKMALTLKQQVNIRKSFEKECENMCP